MNKKENYDPYEVKSFETNKDKGNRKKIRCCEIGIFPPLEQLGCLMVARTGQGKSNLLQLGFDQ